MGKIHIIPFQLPRTQLNEHEQLRIFYQGLDTKTRLKLDFKGPIPRMTPTKGMEAIKELSAHSLSWYNEGVIKTRNKEFQTVLNQIHDFKNNMNIMTVEVKMAQHKYETLMEGRISNLEETLNNFIKESRIKQKERKVRIDKALADLGASISLMPYSMYARLDLGDLKPTRMRIELANKSTQYPRGIAENLKFSTPEDDECLSFDLIDNEVSDLVKEILPSSTLDSFLFEPILNFQQIIISSLLNSQEKESLVKVLTQHKAVLAWKVADIKGISPSFCTHKILMEDNFKPVVQPQQRLNPKVQDEVKAEIVKLLDSGLIYAIFDSPWVSPIHVVPKKGEFTIKIKDKKKGTENLAADHLSRLENPDLKILNEEAIRDSFPDEYLMAVHERETTEDPWYTKEQENLNPRPKDYSFKDWLFTKVGHTNVSEPVKKSLLKIWLIDCFQEDIVKDPRERSFEDYKWMFNLEINQLADKYELGIGKKGHMLDDIWENCRKVQTDSTYWWYDKKSEEDERRKLRINIEEYDPPMVHVETFEVKRYSFNTGKSFICVTKELMDALPMGRENGSRFRDMIRFLYEGMESEVSLTHVRVVERYVPWKPSRDFTRPLGGTKWFKRLVAYAKCNRDSYERETRLFYRHFARSQLLQLSLGEESNTQGSLLL
ncbi:BYPASS-related protein [Tanacetum coccineum]|uniref:BYPASS-related protein n=1 Tax=Tanacetum coccineum TaxID=301880 RepID=A0ABQ5BF60_9ASTR